MTFRLQNCAATGYSWWLVAPHIAWGRPSECGVAPFPLSPRHRGTIAPLASIALSIASTFQRWTLERVLHSMVSCYKYVSVFNTQGHCAVVSRARGGWPAARVLYLLPVFSPSEVSLFFLSSQKI